MSTTGTVSLSDRIRDLWDDDDLRRGFLIGMALGILCCAWLWGSYLLYGPHASQAQRPSPSDCALSAQQAKEFPRQPLSVADMRLRRDCAIEGVAR